ncbi:MAG: MBL fold metallo-hydrolase [Rhizobiales bacterium]|nr:MBL fold metallo-hydrolase [Hyphomicrobiales bacterium]
MKLTRRNMLWGLAALGLAAGFGGWLKRMSSGVYRGPVSDHFDGVRFVGPHAVESNGTFAFWRWQFTRDKAEWPDAVANPPADKPPAKVTAGARWSFVGHASHLLQTGGLNILIDPVWSERASPLAFAGPKRVRPPGIGFDDLPKIDVVLITHGHYDHLDVATLARLRDRDQPRIVAPLGHDATIGGAVETHDWGARVPFNDQVAVTLTPAQHWTARGLFDRNKALWASYVIETPAGRIYHLTDTGYDDALFKAARETYGPFRLAVIPIGAYEPRWFMRRQHVNPEESVRLFRDCGAEQALAHHFGTFQLTDEAFDAPVIALHAACDAQNVPRDRFVVPAPGQVLEM